LFIPVPQAKKLLKAQKFDTDVSTGGGQDDDAAEGQGRGGGDSDDDDEDKYAEDALMPGQKFETKQRITVRNLRIREDTAKYLHNLDVNSAHYDPKTRSMRENPFAGTGRGAKDVPYAGDNFVRYSGAAMDMARQQVSAMMNRRLGSGVTAGVVVSTLASCARDRSPDTL
jgi:pre-mRNA-processing factor SLU7